jgi:DNA-directed RNA polymerase specialized sigma24 family protein
MSITVPSAAISRAAAERQLAALLAGLYIEHSALVGRVAARNLRPADRHLVEDISQDVWLAAWRYLLRGNTIDRPAGLLATMARRRVVDHCRLARVRREVVTDTTCPVSVFAQAQVRELVAA